MYEQKRVLERELKITEAYIKNKDAHKSIRELRVLEQQIPSYFIDPRDNDLIAGRIDRPFITLSPCLEDHGIDKVAYGIDEISCMELLTGIENDPDYSSEYIDAVKEMIAFWKEENTNTKIRERIPEKYRYAIPSDDFMNDSAVIHPIYRLAGLNLDFKKLYEYGLNGLIQIVSDRLVKAQETGEKNTLTSMIGALELIKGVLCQYAEAVEELRSNCDDSQRIDELDKMHNALINLQSNPPATFQEALQLQTIYMLSTRSVELGRVDDYMCELYVKDMSSGVITHEQAVNLLNNFFSIIDEERGRDTRAIIGGVGRENPQKADEFALLVLDVLDRRLTKFYPQVSLRCYTGMNEEIYNRSLEIIGKGCTFPILYNDDINVPSVMRAMDVPRHIAEQYSFFGCGEYILASRSIGSPNTAINVSKALEVTLFNGKDPHSHKKMGLETGEITSDITFDEVMSRFKTQLSFFCDISGNFEELLYDVCNEEASFLLISILQHDCIEKARGMLDGGLYHLGGTVETYGNVTAYDSMTAIKDAVFTKNILSIEKLLLAMQANFEGYEKELAMLKKSPKFGNDNDFADDVAIELHEFICNGIRNQKNKTRLDSFLVVIINNSMNETLGRFVGALPNGRLAKEYLSNGNSPTNGCDKNGITALINSMAKLDTSIHAGGSHNLKISPSYFKDEYKAIKSVISTFFQLGGQHVNLTIVNQADMEDAMIHPENHENLIVRVGGFSARFIYLAPAVQKDILERTTY